MKFVLKLFIFSIFCFSQLYCVNNSDIVLDHPIIGLIDGKAIGINANIFGVILQSRREVRKLLYGVVGADGKRVGLYDFEGQKYSLIELLEIEKEYNAAGKESAGLSAAFENAREDFIRNTSPYLDSARGMKEQLLMIIQDFCDKKGLDECFLLDWSKTEDGGEMDSMNENMKSISDLVILCTDMADFLEVLARSCPVAKALFIKMVKEAKA